MHGHSRRGPKTPFELPSARAVLIFAACVSVWMLFAGYLAGEFGSKETKTIEQEK